MGRMIHCQSTQDVSRTGDNAGTAASIAQTCGILDSQHQQRQERVASNGATSTSAASSRPSSNIGADGQRGREGMYQHVPWHVNWSFMILVIAAMIRHA